MSDDKIKQRFYPLKPKNEEGFKKAVAWLGGREFIASLKGVIIYAIYGENMDPRSWMKPNIYPNVEEKLKLQEEDKLKDTLETEKKSGQPTSDVLETQAHEQFNKNPQIQKEIKDQVNQEWAKKITDYWNWKSRHFKFWEIYLKEQKFWEKLQAEQTTDEFWFDYIADSGDGQMGVYGVACMCLSDLWLELKENKAGKKIEQVDAAVRIIPPKLVKDKDDSIKIENLENFKLLPRGNFLFVGGDTAYHSANYATLFERFQSPFRWAFMSVRKLASRKDTYLLKKKFVKSEDGKKKVIEKQFLVGSDWVNVFKPDTIEPVDIWDGTIGDTIEGKKYWDTEPQRPIFGIPANHDYYDSIDGFNKQFRRAPFDEIEENMVYDDDKSRMVLQIPTFSREQEASYVAIRLPFGWWMFGIDSENEKLDYRQEVFFKQIMRHQPNKLILTTPEPTTVFGKLSRKKDKTATYLRTLMLSLGLEQPFLNRGKFAPLTGKDLEKCEKQQEKERQYGLEAEKGGGIRNPGKIEGYCRLDLSGDIHHYARYWGANTRNFVGEEFSSENYASLVAGGGGAFFDATETLIGRAINSRNERVLIDGEKNPVRGEIPPQKIYPTEELSRARTADRLFDLWNIKKGGYVQTAGAAIAIIIYSFLLHFSNASKIFEQINKMGLLAYLTQPPNWNTMFWNSKAGTFEPFSAGLILTLAAVLVGWSAYNLNALIANLKEKFFEEEIDENVDGRVKQILQTFYPFFAAAALYSTFLIWLPPNTQPFTKSYFLLVHVVICGLLIWLSMDYSNWLPIRFKVIRTFKDKTFTQMVEDPNEQTDKWYLKMLGQFSREYSYKYFPAHLLVIFAIFVIITGIRSFGNGILSGTFADISLMAVFIGGFALIAYMLAVKTGAAYYVYYKDDKAAENTGDKQTKAVSGKDAESEDGGGDYEKKYRAYFKKYRFYFFVLGIWHTLLQLLTPFIFYFYTNIYLALLIGAIVLMVNGLPITWERFMSFLGKTVRKGRKQSLMSKIFGFKIAPKLMTIGKRAKLTAFWFGYGAIFFILPILIQMCFPSPATVDGYSHRFTVSQLVEYLTPKLIYLSSLWTHGVATILLLLSPEIYAPTLKLLSRNYAREIFFLASVLIVGYLGYYLSRVWFSWYLAVSLAFNGHNNEAGGAARIEGFKHMLRIKVEKKKLTVYVIGFDEAKPEIDQLSLRLVDNFTIECKPVS